MRVTFTHPVKADHERNPKDPRVVFPNHRERGPRRFTYGWEQIAAVLKCSEKRAQNMACERLFDPTDFESIVAFAASRRRAPSRRATVAP